MGRLSAGERRRFAEVYMKELDAGRAAAAIGRADGAAILRQPAVQKELRQRRAALPQTQDIARRLAEIAFGRANDCVRLALDPAADLDALDLTLLTEVKRSERGAVEVKLCDRLEALAQLSALCGDGGGAEEFFRALEEEEA